MVYIFLIPPRFSRERCISYNMPCVCSAGYNTCIPHDRSEYAQQLHTYVRISTTHTYTVTGGTTPFQRRTYVTLCNTKNHHLQASIH